MTVRAFCKRLFHTLIVAQFCLAVGLALLALGFLKFAAAFGIVGVLFTCWLIIQEIVWRIQDASPKNQSTEYHITSFENFVLYGFLLPLYVFSPVTYLFFEEKFILWAAATYVSLAIIFEIIFRTKLLNHFVQSEEEYQATLKN